MMATGSMAWINPAPSVHATRKKATTQEENNLFSMRLYLITSSSSPLEEEAAEHSAILSSSRRQWLKGIIGAAVTAQCIPLLPARAADLVTAKSVCDPTVSVWKRNGRLIYLLGTAHISSSSAELAGSLVRDTHPNAVFVELDPKRISGSGILANRVSIGPDGQEVVEKSTSKVIVPRIFTPSDVSPTTRNGDETGVEGTMVATAPSPPATKEKPQAFNPLVRAGSMAVGNAIKGMYKKMDSAGFNAGEEFVVAIREGQTIGADIVLGDRDVEVTLRRLTEGLAQTDLSALFNPDSDLERSMKELVPSSIVDSSVKTTGDLSDAQFRDEFSTFVETMKTKENVKKIMGQLQKTAPALYKALVSERDAYMAAGLNGLNDYEVIVTVVGIAHVDGIEANLEENGWKPCSPRCAGV
jgi:pheromone shutdown protein TraB